MFRTILVLQDFLTKLTNLDLPSRYQSMVLVDETNILRPEVLRYVSSYLGPIVSAVLPKNTPHKNELLY